MTLLDKEVVDGMYTAAQRVLYRHDSPVNKILRQCLKSIFKLLTRHRMAIRVCSKHCTLTVGSWIALICTPQSWCACSLQQHSQVNDPCKPQCSNESQCSSSTALSYSIPAMYILSFLQDAPIKGSSKASRCACPWQAEDQKKSVCDDVLIHALHLANRPSHCSGWDEQAIERGSTVRTILVFFLQQLSSHLVSHTFSSCSLHSRTATYFTCWITTQDLDQRSNLLHMQRYTYMCAAPDLDFWFEVRMPLPAWSETQSDSISWIDKDGRKFPPPMRVSNLNLAAANLKV